MSDNNPTSLQSVTDAPLAGGMRVLVRADFDVAMNGGRITEDFRLKEVIPTLTFLLAKGCRIRLIAHLGRPGGRRRASLTMQPIARRISRLMKRRVTFIPNPFTKTAFRRHDHAGDILFFENIRFWQGEEKNSSLVAEGLAAWGDIYVNEAFANSHREHASMVALAQRLPSFAGLRLAHEVTVLSRVHTDPPRPLVAVLGGAKLETKMPLIRQMLKDADHVLIGGALANTMFALKGWEVGQSLYDGSFKSSGSSWRSDPRLHLPADVVVASSERARARSRISAAGAVNPDEAIMDIGPQSIRDFILLLRGAKMVVWNGPLGYVENPRYVKGTIAFARAMSSLHAFTIVGGGDSVAVLHRYHLLKNFSHISTGGGAMLEFLTGKELPGLQVLKK